MPHQSRTRATVAATVLALLMTLTAACGTKTTPDAGSGAVANPSAASSDSSTNPSMNPSTMASASGACAQAGTRSFQKTRMVADLALAYGAFHRYLYKPYQAGKFTKGASGRTIAIIKGGLAAAAIAKLVNNAAANASADPTLCKAVPSMSSIAGQVGGLGSQLAGGAAAAGGLSQAEGLFSKLKSVVGFGDSNAGLPGLG